MSTSEDSHVPTWKRDLILRKQTQRSPFRKTSVPNFRKSAPADLERQLSMDWIFSPRGGAGSPVSVVGIPHNGNQTTTEDREEEKGEELVVDGEGKKGGRRLSADRQQSAAGRGGNEGQRQPATSTSASSSSPQHGGVWRVLKEINGINMVEEGSGGLADPLPLPPRGITVWEQDHRPRSPAASDVGTWTERSPVEYRYGPGIVERLRSKFISLSIKRDGQGTANGGIRRVASLEQLLDHEDDSPPTPEPIPVVTKAPLTHALSANSYVSARACPAVVRYARRRPQPPSSDVLKRARSMENLTGFDTKLSSIDTNHRLSWGPQRDAVALALANENLVIIEHSVKGSAINGTVLTNGDFRRPPDLANLRLGIGDWKATVALDDKELPKPDTVRTCKRIFESQTSVPPVEEEEVRSASPLILKKSLSVPSPSPTSMFPRVLNGTIAGFPRPKPQLPVKPPGLVARPKLTIVRTPHVSAKSPSPSLLSETSSPISRATPSPDIRSPSITPVQMHNVDEPDTPKSPALLWGFGSLRGTGKLDQLLKEDVCNVIAFKPNSLTNGHAQGNIRDEPILEEKSPENSPLGDKEFYLNHEDEPDAQIGPKIVKVDIIDRIRSQSSSETFNFISAHLKAPNHIVPKGPAPVPKKLQENEKPRVVSVLPKPEVINLETTHRKSEGNNDTGSGHNASLPGAIPTNNFPTGSAHPEATSVMNHTITRPVVHIKPILKRQEQEKNLVNDMLTALDGPIINGFLEVASKPETKPFGSATINKDRAIDIPKVAIITSTEDTSKPTSRSPTPPSSTVASTAPMVPKPSAKAYHAPASPLVKTSTPLAKPVQSKLHLSDVPSSPATSPIPSILETKIEVKSPSPEPTPNVDVNTTPVSATSAEKSSFPRKQTEKVSPIGTTTTQTFNFVGKKDVVTHVANRAAPFSVQRPTLRNIDKLLGGRGSATVVGEVKNDDLDEEEDYSASGSGHIHDPDAYKPCGISFEGENVIIGRTSILRSRNKQLRISFDDSALSTYEYPSETSVLEEFPASDDETGGATTASDPPPLANGEHNAKPSPPASSPGGLASYTPTVLTSALKFELGVSRTTAKQKPPTEPTTNGTSKSGPEDEDLVIIKPASDEQNTMWSNDASSDILF